MLGRRQAKDSKPAGSKGAAKKRKWQEELDSDSEGEAKITKADLEAWEATVKQEEEDERKAKEKQEQEEKEKQRKAKEAAEERRKREQDEEDRAQNEAAEARKLAEVLETEARRQDTLAPPGALPPDVSDGNLPPGMNPAKMHLYKSTYCKRWEQGNCNFGAACHFAHGNRDLRGNRPLRPLAPGAPGSAQMTMPGGAAHIVPPPAPVALHVPVGAPGVPAHLGPMRPPMAGAGQVVMPPTRPDQTVAFNQIQMMGMFAAPGGKGALPGKGQPQVVMPPGYSPGGGLPHAAPLPTPQWPPQPPHPDVWPQPGAAGGRDAAWQPAGAEAAWQPSASADAAWQQSAGVDAAWQQSAGGADVAWQPPLAGSGGDVAAWHQATAADAAWQQPAGDAAWNAPGGASAWAM